MNIVDRNIKIYYISLFLLSFALTIPHSILTVLFLSKGIKMSDIIFVQSLFNLSMIIFEIPSGVISDLYSRKNVYIFSLISLILTFLFIIFTNNLFFLSIAYIIYGISSALKTGTIEVDLINRLKNNEHLLQKFFKYQNQLSIISSIIGSGIGFWLYFRIGVNIYFISIFLTILNIMIVMALFKNEENEKISSVNFEVFKIHIVECLEELKEKKIMKYYFIFFGIIQIFIQSHFQFWQKIFLEKNISEKNFFIVYILFQIVTIVSYNVNVISITMKKSVILIIMSFIILVTLKIVDVKILFTVLYLALCFIMFIMNYYFSFHFSKILSKERMSAIISIKSFFSRIFLFFTLFISSIILKRNNALNIFIINLLLVLIVVMYILVKINNIQKKRIKIIE